MIWNGSEFLLAYSDNREDHYRIYGRHLSASGELVGEEVGLTGFTLDAEAPSLAEGQKSVLVAFALRSGGQKQVAASVLPPTFDRQAELIVLGTDNAVAPVAVFSRDRYVVVWEKKTDVPGDAIWGATLSETGDILQSERRLTTGSAFARAPGVLPLGDRVLLTFSQYENGRFRLYTKMLSSTLEELSAETPIPTGSGDALFATGAFGPNGDVGVIFGDNGDGDWQVYFARLVCGAGR
jgi:hypothetical protein